MNNPIDPFRHKHLDKKKSIKISIEEKKKILLNSGKSDVRQVELTESEDNRC